MRHVFILLLLPQLVSSGDDPEIGCKATSEGNLMCTFPENVNTTEADFGVYFYPVDGGEEPLVDCGWVNSKLRCIQQEGVECKSPVNNTAVIIIPTRFLEKNGKYRCVSDGHNHNTIKPFSSNAARMLPYFSSVIESMLLVAILLFY